MDESTEKLSQRQQKEVDLIVEVTRQVLNVLPGVPETVQRQTIDAIIRVIYPGIYKENL